MRYSLLLLASCLLAETSASAATSLTLTLSPQTIYAHQAFSCTAHVSDNGSPGTGTVTFGMAGGGGDWSGATIPLDQNGDATMHVLPDAVPGHYWISATHRSTGARQDIEFDVLARPAVPTLSVGHLLVLAVSLGGIGVILARHRC